MVIRHLSKIMGELSKQYPVITVTGPRQSGKTTLVKTLFKNKPYRNLENPDEREFAVKDPRAFLARVKDGAIIDEIQRVPSLLSYIQTYVDERKIPGLFILTGSQNLNLLSSISQSLAGRTAILKLLPFDIDEISRYDKNLPLEQLLLNGTFPAIYEKNLNPTIFYRSYYETYIERDLRQLINVKDLHLFQIFIRLCAGRVGQLFNANSLSNETGVSTATIKSWLSILEASYVLFLLEPFHENINKRLTKARKIYFYDAGLASYLLGIENVEQALTHPLRGNLFENLVVTELIKQRFNKGLDHNLCFYRDSNGNEIDILFRHGHLITPVEIKTAETFNSGFLKGLTYIKKVLPSKIGNGFLIYGGNIEQKILNNTVINFKNCSVVFKTR
ncbi:MAG: ATP-binding protein [Candidatus Omnitrophica bacterium]|nr:ATP-binding protein [Candidatus Omnitrophota bacterium]